MPKVTQGANTPRPAPASVASADRHYSAWQIVKPPAAGGKHVARLLGLKGLVDPNMFWHYLAEDMLRSGTPLESVP